MLACNTSDRDGLQVRVLLHDASGATNVQAGATPPWHSLPPRSQAIVAVACGSSDVSHYFYDGCHGFALEQLAIAIVPAAEANQDAAMPRAPIFAPHPLRCSPPSPVSESSAVDLTADETSPGRTGWVEDGATADHALQAALQVSLADARAAAPAAMHAAMPAATSGAYARSAPRAPPHAEVTRSSEVIRSSAVISLLSEDEDEDADAEGAAPCAEDTARCGAAAQLEGTGRVAWPEELDGCTGAGSGEGSASHSGASGGGEEEQRCPVCGQAVVGGEHEMNAHLDACLHAGTDVGTDAATDTRGRNCGGDCSGDATSAAAGSGGELLICPVCQVAVAGGEGVLNEHVDYCLSRGMLDEAAAEVAAEAGPASQLHDAFGDAQLAARFQREEDSKARGGLAQLLTPTGEGTCPICLECISASAATSDGVRLDSCQHCMHRACLQQALQAQVAAGCAELSCSVCRRALLPSEARTLLGADALATQQERTVERAAGSDASFLRCPTADCTNTVWWEPPGAAARAQPGESAGPRSVVWAEHSAPKLDCPACGQQACLLCKVRRRGA